VEDRVVVVVVVVVGYNQQAFCCVTPFSSSGTNEMLMNSPRNVNVNHSSSLM